METLTFTINNNYISDVEQGEIIAHALITENFPNIPKGKNPRDVIPKGKIYEAICNGLEENKNFHRANRGIWVLASNLKGSNCIEPHPTKPDHQLLTINIDSEENSNSGHYDGGHTLHAIQSKKEALVASNKERYVQLTVYDQTDYDASKEVRMVAQALNSMRRQEPRSEADIQGHFDWIKDTLEEKYNNNISFYDGDSGKIRIEKLLMLMQAVSNEGAFKKNGDVSKNWTEKWAKKGQNSMVNYYVDRIESYEGLHPVLNDIILLADFIQISANDFWDGRYKKTCLARKFNSRKQCFGKPYSEDTFDDSYNESDYHLHMEYIYPIVCSLCNHYLNYDEGNNVYYWKDGGISTPMKLWKIAANEALHSMNDLISGDRMLTEYKARVSDFAICPSLWLAISKDIINATKKL